MIELPWYPTQRQLRQFAWASPVGFALVGFAVWRATGSREAWIALAGFGLLVLVAGLARPGLVRPIYLLALVVAFPIGWVVSNLAFLSIYYLLITPLALFFRLVGRDALALKRRRSESCWRDHPGTSDPARYWRQG